MIINTPAMIIFSFCVRIGVPTTGKIDVRIKNAINKKIMIILIEKRTDIIFYDFMRTILMIIIDKNIATPKLMPTRIS